MATPKRNFIEAMATAGIGCLAALACAGTSPALAGNDSTPETRWWIATALGLLKAESSSK